MYLLYTYIIYLFDWSPYCMYISQWYSPVLGFKAISLPMTSWGADPTLTSTLKMTIKNSKSKLFNCHLLTKFKEVRKKSCIIRICESLDSLGQVFRLQKSHSQKATPC